MKRSDFFKDKGLLFFCFFMEVISLYLFLTFIENTYFFIIPIFLFGFLGLLELWFIFSKKELEGKNEKTINSN